MNEEEIFQVAAEMSAAERAAYLAIACEDQPALHERVQRLLASHDEGGFMQRSADLPDSATLEVERARLKPKAGADRIGHYQLLEKIGEGGMGVVYMAQQEEPVRRRVALKVIKLGMDTHSVIARFEAERQALAMMDHPNIAKILDGGVTDASGADSQPAVSPTASPQGVVREGAAVRIDALNSSSALGPSPVAPASGRPYFVMELVNGVPITEFCDQNRLSAEQRLNLFIPVCLAIQHAHQKGIIHRDLKPSNVLVTLHDGVPVPKVIDFGVAKALNQKLTEKTFFTNFATMIGTPAYMSPEQAEMSGLDIDTRSDIYGLGVLLYELLTGTTPFSADRLRSVAYREMQRIILEEEPERPSTRLTKIRASSSPVSDSASRVLPAAVEPDLDWIVMKCLEKDRVRRYDTANGLAEDLKRHLNNEPVVARPPSAADRLQKAWRRNRLAFTAVAAVATALLLGIGVSTWQAFRANSEKVAAQHNLYLATMNLAGAAWEQHNFDSLRKLLEDTRASPDRGFEWYYWQRQAHLNVKTLRGHVGHVRSVAFSPDGQRIVTGGADQTVRVWEVASGQELLKLIGHKGWVHAVAFSPDGLLIVTGGDDQTARVWEAATGRELFKLTGHEAQINSAAFSPDGQRIVTGSSDSTAKVWEVATRRLLVTFKGHGNRVNSVAFSRDGQRIVTGSHDHTARVWDVASGSEVHQLAGHDREVFSAVFSPDGQRIVTGSIYNIAKFWDAASGQELPSPQLKGRGTMTSLAFSPDGRHIVIGSWTATATLWDAATGQEELTIRGHALGVICVAFSPDGGLIATGSGEGEVKLWVASSARQPLTLQGNLPSVTAMAISPDGQRIVSGVGIANTDGTVGGSGDQAARVWDAASGKQLFTLSGHSSGVSSVAFSSDGHRLVTGSGDQTARIWDAATGTALQTLTGRGPISSVAFSPDGQRIVTGSLDHTASVWDVASEQERFQLIGHTAPITAVAWSPDGQRIVSGSHDQTVRLWDATTGAEIRKINFRSERVVAVAFSPDGQRIAAGGWGRAAMVWEAASGRELLTLKGHNSPVGSISFSRDGRRIVTAGYDFTARVWEAVGGRELLTLHGHGLGVASAAFTPDGQRIVTGSWDGTVKIWEAARPDEVAAWDEEERVAETSRAGWERELDALQREYADAERRQRIALARGDEGAIKRWLILAPVGLGPGENAAQGLDREQLKGEALLRPKAEAKVTVGSSELRWQAHSDEDYALDFNTVSGGVMLRSVAYAVSYLWSDVEQRGVQLLLGYDDGAKVYLNGQPIYHKSPLRVYFADQHRVSDLRLNPGLNVLVFKVVNETSEWRGSVRLTDAGGNPVQGIRVTLDPEAKDVR